MHDELAVERGDPAFEEDSGLEMTIRDDNTGKVNGFTRHDLDREIASDVRVWHKPVRQRRATPIIRRARTRARIRCSLRPGRPQGRRTSSRASASSGTDPDDPEPARPAPRARLAYACLTPAKRGEVVI
jgi:hypothetical protein